MAIDAVIERIRPTEAGLRLELAPRVESDGRDSISGTRVLTILGRRTFEPQVGMSIWGSATGVEIVATPPRDYDRKGNNLRERRFCSRCLEWAHWARIYAEGGDFLREVYLCDACGHEEAL